jgi:hypothetical protein
MHSPSTPSLMNGMPNRIDTTSDPQRPAQRSCSREQHRIYRIEHFVERQASVAEVKRQHNCTR